MNITSQIAQALLIVDKGYEDPKTGELMTVDEIKITYEVKGSGDFEIIVRRPKSNDSTEGQSS